METFDNELNLRLDRAKELQDLGNHLEALEQYKSALVRMDKEHPRREEVESAIALLQISTTLAVEPAQLEVWRRLRGWAVRRRKTRWSILGALVLIEMALFLSGRTNLDKSASLGAAVTPTSIPEEVADAPSTELALAPTPLAAPPSATPFPSPKPTPTATILPSVTPTRVPTFTLVPTLIRPIDPPGGRDGSSSSSSNATSPTSPRRPTPAPGPAPAPGPIPAPPSSGGGNVGSGSGGGGTGHGGGNGNGNGNGNSNGPGGKGKHK